MLRVQLQRFVMVGLGVNIFLYLTYLVLVHAGTGVKSAMTIAYATGVVAGFLLNRQWTFSFDGGLSGPFWKYIIAYLSGYILNYICLLVFVDLAGLSHQLVQGLVVIVLAILMFAAQKYWIFRMAPEKIGNSSPGSS